MPEISTTITPSTPTFGDLHFGTATRLSIILEGAEYALDDGTYCYWLGDDGLGMAPLHRLSERGPLQHGDTDKGFRLDPRIVRLVLSINANSQALLDVGRRNLIAIFRPANLLTLKLVEDDMTFHLDCFYVSDMAMPSSERDGWNQNVVVTLKANDPAFYDPEGEGHSFVIEGGSDTCEVPTVIPMTIGIGATTVYITEAITNSGTMWAWPKIHIHGPIANPLITNDSTGEKLDFAGTTIAAGDYYDIDLRYGYKTVIDAAGVNQIAHLTNDSDLVSWHLGCNPEVPGGINSVTVWGSGMTDASEVSLTWLTKYIGI